MFKMAAAVACFLSGRGLMSRPRGRARAGQSAHRGQLVKMGLWPRPRHACEQWICKLKNGSLSKGLNRRIVCGSSIGHKLDDEYESLHWIGTNRFCDTWFRLD